jgi:hypothetical protein
MSRYDEQSEELLGAIPEQALEGDDVGTPIILAPAAARSVSFGQQENWFSFSVESETQGDETIEEEVTRCFECLVGKLSSPSRRLALILARRIPTIKGPITHPDPAPKLPARQHGRLSPRKQGILFLLRQLTALPSVCLRCASAKPACTTRSDGI